MVETMKKVEILAGEKESIELSETPGKREVRIRVSTPGEWASIRLTREQWEAVCNLRYDLEVRA